MACIRTALETNQRDVTPKITESRHDKSLDQYLTTDQVSKSMPSRSSSQMEVNINKHLEQYLTTVQV